MVCQPVRELCSVQGLPVWMEHPAAMDVAGMEAAGVTMDDICFYQVRVSEAAEMLSATGDCWLLRRSYMQPACGMGACCCWRHRLAA